MKTKLFVLAAILFVPLIADAGKRHWQMDPSVAGGVAVSPTNGDAPAALTTRRVVQLPEDGDHWWTTLILDSKWQTLPNQRKAQSMMTQDSACSELMSSTKGRIITTDTPIARPYFKYITGTPCLVIQNPEGQVIYSEVNPDLGRRPRELVNEINQTMRRKRHCDGNVCPVVDPEPKPVDDGPKDVPIQPAVGPTVGPGPALPDKKGSPLPAIFALIACGGAAFLLRSFNATRAAMA